MVLKVFAECQPNSIVTGLLAHWSSTQANELEEVLHKVFEIGDDDEEEEEERLE